MSVAPDLAGPAVEPHRRLRLPRLTGAVFADLALWMAGFGLLVGLVFPFFVVATGLPAERVLRPGFFAATVAAGLLVAGVNVALARAVVGYRLRTLIARMGSVRHALQVATDSGDFAGCDPASCHLDVDSRDELGSVAVAFNELVDAVARSHAVEQAIAHTANAVTGRPDARALAAAALSAVVESTQARGGAILVRHDGSARELVREGQLPGSVDPRQLWDAEPSVGLAVTPVRAGDDVDARLVLDVDHSPGLRRLLTLVGDTLGVALATAHLHQRLAEQARVDDLTGIANRRAGLTVLHDELHRALRAGTPLAVVLLDIDHFKSVNDTHGHQAGDMVLRQVSQVCSAQLRPGDVLCRYGGEELLAVLPGATAVGGMEVAERLRLAVAGTAVPAGGLLLRVTVSAGVAGTVPTATTRAEDLVAAADRALYAAKAGGRDRVLVADTATVTA